jgi:mRNA interferase MazF
MTQKLKILAVVNFLETNRLDSKTINPRQGEIWLVDLSPTVGAEIDKLRPVVVVNIDNVFILPLRMIVPITSWKPHFEKNLWHIQIAPDKNNKINNVSAIDVFQIRCVSVYRFKKKIGDLAIDKQEEAAITISLLTEVS